MKKKKVLDGCMVILLLLLMTYPYMEQVVHELLGSILLLCFILHHVLNHTWYRMIKKGINTTIKKVYFVLTTLLLIDMGFMFLSGVAMSQLFPYFAVMSASTARSIHMISTYWGFVLMAVHLGLHMNAILTPINRRIQKKLPSIYRVICCIPYVISAYGMLMFLKHQWIAYLFRLTEFVYFDNTITIIRVIIEYFTIFILFLTITMWIQPVFLRRREIIVPNTDKTKDNIKLEDVK